MRGHLDADARGVGQIVDLSWELLSEECLCNLGWSKEVTCQLCRNHGTEVHRLHDCKGCVDDLCNSCALLSLHPTCLLLHHILQRLSHEPITVICTW